MIGIYVCLAIISFILIGFVCYEVSEHRFRQDLICLAETIVNHQKLIKSMLEEKGMKE